MGKVTGASPALSHYVNPNTSIQLQLSESCADVGDGDNFVCEILYTLDGVTQSYPVRMTSQLGSSILSSCEIVIDGVRCDLRVELPRMSNPMTGVMTINGWSSYVSERDFARLVINEIRIDWDTE